LLKNRFVKKMPRILAKNLIIVSKYCDLNYKFLRFVSKPTDGTAQGISRKLVPFQILNKMKIIRIKLAVVVIFHFLTMSRRLPEGH
jgi:hypothetical protein